MMQPTAHISGARTRRGDIRRHKTSDYPAGMKP